MNDARLDFDPTRCSFMQSGIFTTDFSTVHSAWRPQLPPGTAKMVLPSIARPNSVGETQDYTTVSDPITMERNKSKLRESYKKNDVAHVRVRQLDTDGLGHICLILLMIFRLNRVMSRSLRNMNHHPAAPYRGRWDKQGSRIFCPLDSSRPRNVKLL